MKPPWANKTFGFLGMLDGERCYVSPRDRAEHFYRKYNGYAIDEKLTETLDALDVQRVFIRERDTDDVYEYTLRQFIESPLVIDHEGFRRQKCVPTPKAQWCWQNLGMGLWKRHRVVDRPEDVSGIRGQSLKQYQNPEDGALP